jgi:osmotically-inducible protein OsmY
MIKMGKSDELCATVIDDLTFDPDVDASDIRVEETDGDVVLTGSVPSYPQYLQAAAVAARAADVRGVRNHLQVVLPPGDHRDDLTLAAMASDALTLGGSAPAEVEATVKDGDITLTGSVRTGTEREAAELMVAELTGVRRVRNDIQSRISCRTLFHWSLVTNPSPGLVLRAQPLG